MKSKVPVWASPIRKHCTVRCKTLYSLLKTGSGTWLKIYTWTEQTYISELERVPYNNLVANGAGEKKEIKKKKIELRSDVL